MANEKKKILIVEDNLMSKTLVKDILLMNGYDVLEAEVGVAFHHLLGTMTRNALHDGVRHLPGPHDGVEPMSPAMER